VFPLEQGAKKGTSIQEQAITTAVLGVQCADCAALCTDVTTSLPCSVHVAFLAIAVSNTLSLLQTSCILRRHSTGSSNPCAKRRVHLWAVGVDGIGHDCIHAASSIVHIAVWSPSTFEAAQPQRCDHRCCYTAMIELEPLPGPQCFAEFEPSTQCCRTVSRLAVGAQPAKSLCVTSIRPRGGHPVHTRHPAGQYGAWLEQRACGGFTEYMHVACRNVHTHQAPSMQAVHTEGQVVSLAKELVQQEQQVLR
jgi:hypothetical protein